MKKLILLLIIITPLVFAVNSCKPDDDFKPQDFPVPQEVLDYFHFKPGSMWIFQNDKTNALDTITVIDASKAMEDGLKGDKYEKARSVWYSSFDKYQYHYFVFTQGTAGCIREGSKWPCYRLKCLKTKTGDVLGESISWDYPFTKDYGGAADFSGQGSTYFLKDIDIDVDTFKNAVQIFIKKSLVLNRKDVHIFWKKHIGIIKKENITDGENWNLIYYNIIK